MAEFVREELSQLFPEGWICRIVIYFRVFLNLREGEVLLVFCLPCTFQGWQEKQSQIKGFGNMGIFLQLYTVS